MQQLHNQQLLFRCTQRCLCALSCLVLAQSARAATRIQCLQLPLHRLRICTYLSSQAVGDMVVAYVLRGVMMLQLSGT